MTNQTRYANQDMVTKVLSDCCTTALSGGFRCKEWCLPQGSGLLQNIQDCLFNGPRAFILNNVEFYDKNQVMLNTGAAITEPDKVFVVKICYM